MIAIPPVDVMERVRDDELRGILLEEVVRREQEALQSDEPQAARRVAHALKGTLGLAGEREASESFARVERRIAAGDPEALSDLRRAITGVRALLEQGAPLPSSSWPEPPHDLAPSTIASEEASHYLAAVHDRLSRIDAVLGGEAPPELSVREIYREVHTIKGAALATGDEVMAWFCHGLEERLRELERISRELQDIERRHREAAESTKMQHEHARAITACVWRVQPSFSARQQSESPHLRSSSGKLDTLDLKTLIYQWQK